MDHPPKRSEREVMHGGGGRHSLENTYDEFVTDLIYEIFENEVSEQGIDIKKGKVLELGSGNAMLLDYAKKQGVDIFGVDITANKSSNSPQTIARIERLPHPDATFEVVLAYGVFDDSVYNHDQVAMMKEVSRILKPDGILVCSGANLFQRDLDTTSLGLRLVKESHIAQVYKKYC